MLIFHSLKLLPLYIYCIKFLFFILRHEGIDIDAATKHGIKVARIPGDATGNAASCAEMAIYLMLGLLRKQVYLFYLVTKSCIFL